MKIDAMKSVIIKKALNVLHDNDIGVAALILKENTFEDIINELNDATGGEFIEADSDCYIVSVGDDVKLPVFKEGNPV